MCRLRGESQLHWEGAAPKGLPGGEEGPDQTVAGLRPRHHSPLLTALERAHTMGLGILEPRGEGEDRPGQPAHPVTARLNDRRDSCAPFLSSLLRKRRKRVS